MLLQRLVCQTLHVNKVKTKKKNVTSVTSGVFSKESPVPVLPHGHEVKFSHTQNKSSEIQGTFQFPETKLRERLVTAAIMRVTTGTNLFRGHSTILTRILKKFAVVFFFLFCFV